MPEVAKNISAARHYFQLFALHRNISFNLFKRALIRSISRCGVLMPCVDLFWNAWSRCTQTDHQLSKVIFRKVRQLHHMLKQSHLQRLVPMNRNGKTYIASLFSLNMMAALNPKQDPPVTLKHFGEVFTGY